MSEEQTWRLGHQHTIEASAEDHAIQQEGRIAVLLGQECLKEAHCNASSVDESQGDETRRENRLDGPGRELSTLWAARGYSMTRHKDDLILNMTYRIPHVWGEAGDGSQLGRHANSVPEGFDMVPT